MPKQPKQPNKGRAKGVTLAIVILCAAVLAAGFMLLIRGVNKQILATNIDSMEELALHDQRSIKNSIELRWDTMEGAVVRMSARDWQSDEELLSAMRELLNNIPSVDRIVLLDESGTEHSSTGLVREDSYLAPICAEHTERFIARVNTQGYFRENQTEMLFEAVPVDFEVCGTRMRWMICEFPISTLEAELKIDSYNGEGFSSIIDPEGNYIINVSRVHNFGTYDNFFTDMEDVELEGYASVRELITTTTTTGGALSVVYTRDGQESIMVITTIDYAGWYFITMVPASVFSVQANAILRLFSLLLGIIAIVAVGLMLLFARGHREREALRLAEAGSRAKTEFLFNMSHDIRTPMNAILGYTNIALRHADDEAQTLASLHKIQTAGGHLLNLINDILEMSRIEAGRVELTLAPVDICASGRGVVQMNEALATTKSIAFTAELEDLPNPYVYADELHMNEVIINLISNAIKYTPEGGRVRYTARQLTAPENGTALYQFEIEDNGIGMSEEFQTHLFEAFSREESAGVSKIEGAGLGLSIVKRIVDLAGGTIRVKSAPGKGSLFTVELPFKVLTEEEIAALRAAERERKTIVAPESFAGKRVLLVEDNEMNREIATDILSDAGFVVEEAEDGELAVEAVAEKGVEYFDYVLMDIQMPVMNGYEATRAIRALQDGDRVPIIALSANAFEEDRQASLAAGMNAHVAKPIDVKQLLDTLAAL